MASHPTLRLEMRQISVVAFLLTVFFVSLASPQSKTPSKKKTTAKKSRASSRTVKRAPAAYRQPAPTPERYKEIQQALADKGYLKSEPNGVWDAQSTAALAQFQSDRKLDAGGKLTAASLIALGLGPSTAPIPPDPKAKTAVEATPPPTPAN